MTSFKGRSKWPSYPQDMDEDLVVFLESLKEAISAITSASVAAGAGLIVPHGVAPTSPVDGLIWTTTAGMFVQIDGVTKTVTLT